MAKYGPPSVLFLVDGYNMLANKVQTLRHKIVSRLTKSDGLGDTWEEHSPTGVSMAELAQEGAFFDTDALRSHAALSGSVPSSPQAAVRIVCCAFAGNTAGEMFYGFEGDFTGEYEVVAARGDLQKANTLHRVTGQCDEGVIIQALAVKTADWDTESASIDNAASSADGGVGYQQVTAFTGFTGFIGKIRDSADDIAYSDLITFTNVTSAPAAERATVAGTVDRYLAFDGDVTGVGSITVFCGFSRS
jgi:hypothetical protein